MFERALALFPEHGRSLLGLAAALDRLDLRAEKADAIERATRATRDLDAGGRVSEAAMTSAFLHIVCGRPDEALRMLEQLLTGPPSFAGWTIPVEPLFAELRAALEFQSIATRLSSRAS